KQKLTLSLLLQKLILSLLPLLLTLLLPLRLLRLLLILLLLKLLLILLLLPLQKVVRSNWSLTKAKVPPRAGFFFALMALIAIFLRLAETFKTASQINNCHYKGKNG
ncbi:MAG: hypothetical protein K1X77_10615, partial [Bacteroidia bacterium]|nr:hypothetical protein [Bacteroidia bacterium]